MRWGVGGGGGGVNLLIYLITILNKFTCVQFGLTPVHNYSVKIHTNHVTLCKILHNLVLLSCELKKLEK